jgi:hypothetical protein
MSLQQRDVEGAIPSRATTQFLICKYRFKTVFNEKQTPQIKLAPM